MGACLCSENRKIISKYVKTVSSNDSNDNDNNNMSNIMKKFEQYDLEENKILQPNLMNKIELENENDNKIKYKNKQSLQTNHTLENKTQKVKEQSKIKKQLSKKTSGYDIRYIQSLSLKGKKEMNIVLIGEKQTGKSSFIIKLIENRFENLYIPTVFIERSSKQIIYDNKTYTLNFEVTPGVEEYKEDYSELYSKAHFILLFYEVGKKDSLKRAKNYAKKELKNQMVMYSNNLSSIYFIGNKIDIYPNQSNSDIKKYCEKHKINFFEISVKLNTGINALMSQIIQSFHQFTSF